MMHSRAPVCPHHRSGSLSPAIGVRGRKLKIAKRSQIPFGRYL